MQVAARCRKCGRRMKSQRVDNYRVKMTCPCGFSDFRTVTERVKTVNPFYHRGGYTPFLESEKGKMVLTMQKANREHLEIISLEEISMLVSSDYELPRVLELVAQKIAKQLRVSVCSIYLVEDGELVLAATFGFDPAFVGKIRIKMGEGITGTVAQQREYISLDRASQDSRYKNFPELQEDKYNAMLSFPIADRQEVCGVINANSTGIRTFSQDEIHFVSIIATLILSAVKLRRRAAVCEKGAA